MNGVDYDDMHNPDKSSAPGVFRDEAIFLCTLPSFVLLQFAAEMKMRIFSWVQKTRKFVLLKVAHKKHLQLFQMLWNFDEDRQASSDLRNLKVYSN